MDARPGDIDLAALLSPIPGEQPAGVNLRMDHSPQSIYYRLRDARAEARAAERQLDAAPDIAASWPPQWGVIRTLAAQALAEQSKDLEIAAWYMEALLRSDGLSGLAAGCRLMTGLVEVFWDDLHPSQDQDDPEARIAPVAGLNGEGRDGTLIQPLRKLALFTRPDGTPLPLWQYNEAADVSALGDAARKQRRLDAGVLPFEPIEDEARAAAAELATLREMAITAGETWQALSAALAARVGTDAASSSRVRDLLDQIERIAGRYAVPGSMPVQDRAAGGVTDPAASAAEQAQSQQRAAAPSPVGTVAGREDALRQLGEIAAFFRRTEPHSPLAYTLQEAIRRARMSWPELLEEVVPDATARAAILHGLGIKPPRAD